MLSVVCTLSESGGLRVEFESGTLLLKDTQTAVYEL